ncbi:hypothetical protein BGX33_004652 [Mortierella sp. NVP41]|nr:hypothetical protein BGX33_004652 [Mortierella sp. NVP41]
MYRTIISAAQQLLLKPTLDKETLLARSAELARIRIIKGSAVTTVEIRGSMTVIQKATASAGAREGTGGGGGSAIPKKSLWVRFKKEMLRRMSGDLLRLIPFSVFVIVPFMKFLPVALKLFPNMLPSTFEDSFAEEEKKRKLLKMCLEMAKFLQETIIQQQPGTSGSHTATHSGGIATERAEAIKEFGECFRKVRSTASDELPPTSAEMIRVARLFGDELTVDNLSRPQLLSMCRYMNLNAFGTDNFLRYQIRTSMNSIRKDDKKESLTERELHAACQSCGINTTDAANDRLRSELSQWLELHLTYSIPATILVLSRTFSYSDSYIPDRPGKVLHPTLSSLPNTLLYETELHHSEQVGVADAATAANPVLKLKVLQQQEELIAKEKAQEEETRKLCMEQARVEKEIELLERQRLAEEQSATAAPIFLGSSYATNNSAAASNNSATDAVDNPLPLQDQEAVAWVSSDSDQFILKESSSPSSPPPPLLIPKSHLTTRELVELRKALLVMTSPSPVVEERCKLEGLKKQQAHQSQVHQQVQGSFFPQANTSSPPPQQQLNTNTTTATTTTTTTTKVADRLLGSRVEKMISNLDKELQAYESFNIQSNIQPVATNDQNELTVADVEAALRLIKHAPNDETINLVVHKLDIDGDGLVLLDHIFELVDMIEQEEGTGGVIENVVVDGKRLQKTNVLKDH